MRDVNGEVSHPVDVEALMEISEIGAGPYSEEPEDVFADQEMPDWLQCEELGRMPAGVAAFMTAATPRLGQNSRKLGRPRVSRYWTHCRQLPQKTYRMYCRRRA